MLTRDSSLKVAHYNIRSLLSKINEFREYVDVCDYDLICISETWLHGDIPDSAVGISGYTLRRRDRPSRGGGVYVCEELTADVTRRLRWQH